MGGTDQVGRYWKPAVLGQLVGLLLQDVDFFRAFLPGLIRFHEKCSSSFLLERTVWPPAFWEPSGRKVPGTS